MKAKYKEGINPIRIILSMFFGIVASWLIKDGFSLLLQNGRSFENRSLFIQAGILAVLVIFTSALFFLLLSIVNSFFALDEKLQKLVNKIIFNSLYRNVLIILAGLFSLAYVFYAGFFILPPHLYNLTIFSLIFFGLSSLFNSKDNYLKVFTFFVFLGLCFLPITWLWRGVEFDSLEFMGIFPLNDGKEYLADAYRLLWGLNFTEMSTRRPVFIGLFSFILWIFNSDIQIALGIFCVGTAISLYLLAAEIREIAGFIAAALTSTMLIYCYFPYVGRVYTENLGLSLGALGLALLLKGARLKRPNVLSMGAFTLSLALNVRAGAFFVLPALVTWSWVNKKTLGRWIPYLLVGAISVGFAINFLLAKIIGSQQGFLFSNFGYTLYGLASGYKGWSYVISINPSGISETEVYRLALGLIHANPTALLFGVFMSFKDYLLPGTMFRFLNLGNMSEPVCYLLFLLSIIGLYQLIKFRKELHWSLVLALFAGCFLSVSFVPPIDDGIRAMTATIPINTFVAGFAFAVLPSGKQSNHSTNINIPLAYSVFLAICCVFGPVMVKTFNHPVLPDFTLACPEGTEAISVMISRGSFINIVQEGPKYGFIPNIREQDVLARLNGYTSDGDLPWILQDMQSLERWVRILQPGETILIGLNLNEIGIGDGPRQIFYLVTRTSQIQKIGYVNHFCARMSTEARLKANRFYYDISVKSKE